MRVVFFSPHAGVWIHAFPEALVADALRAGGADLVYVTCGGAFGSYCVTMGARGVLPSASEVDKRAVCVECRVTRDRLRAGFRFRGYDLETALYDADHRRVSETLSRARPEAIVELELDGIDVGRRALYEFVIERKKLRLELTADEWTAFRPRLTNALRSLLAAERVLDRERPNAVVVYNSLYSVNAMWRAVADRRAIPFYFVHAGLSLNKRVQRVVVGRDSTLDWWTRALELWPRFRDMPCSRDQLAFVTDHFVELFRGTSAFAYSAAKSATDVDVRRRFGARADQKLLVATMSSYDEYVAAAAVGGLPDPETLLFPTQVDWIRSLVRWVRTRPDLFLIVRVHPREFPNKREGKKSEHAAVLDRELVQLPANARVNWPTDRLSIYDLAEQTDVVLNAWSTAGKEMALLGLPVVTFCPEVLMYPPELNYAARAHDAYFAEIERALRDGWSFARTRAAYRWCVAEFLRGTVDIGDAFDFTEERATSTLSRALNAMLAIPAIRQRYDLARRPPRIAAQRRLAELVTTGRATLFDVPDERRAITEDEETAALRAEVRRLVEALYPKATGAPPRGSLRERLSSVAKRE